MHSSKNKDQFQRIAQNMEGGQHPDDLRNGAGGDSKSPTTGRRTFRSFRRSGLGGRPFEKSARHLTTRLRSNGRQKCASSAIPCGDLVDNADHTQKRRNHEKTTEFLTSSRNRNTVNPMTWPGEPLEFVWRCHAGHTTCQLLAAGRFFFVASGTALCPFGAPSSRCVSRSSPFFNCAHVPTARVFRRQRRGGPHPRCTGCEPSPASFLSCLGDLSICSGPQPQIRAVGVQCSSVQAWVKIVSTPW